MRVSDAIRYRNAIVQASQSLPDDIASTVPDLFDSWQTDTDYEVGDRRKYNGTLYKCLTAHTSQSTWTPDVSPSLWVRADDPGEEWPEWVQPLGSTDAYMSGDKVSHVEHHWISNVDGNVWEPGAPGTDLLWELVE